MSQQDRHEMLAAIATIAEGPRAAALFAYLPEAESAEVQRLARRHLAGERPDGRALLATLQQVIRLNDFSILNEVHPGWIADLLKDESPRVLAAVCRFLPGQKGRYLIERLPAPVRRLMPAVSQAWGVPEELLAMIRQAVERRLGLPLLPRRDEIFSFYHLGWLRADDTRTLLADLGLEEVRKAFHRLPPKALHLFLSRFAPEQARAIRQRFAGGLNVAPAERQRAQRHLVALSIDTLDPEALFLEVGFSCLAQAVLPEDLEWARTLYIKLEPREGYRFKRALAQRAPENRPEDMAAIRDAILDRLLWLTQKEKVRRYWKDPEAMEHTVSVAV